MNFSSCVRFFLHFDTFAKMYMISARPHLHNAYSQAQIADTSGQQLGNQTINNRLGSQGTVLYWPEVRERDG